MSEKKDGGSAFPVNDAASVHMVAIAAVQGVSDPAERDRLYTEAAGRAAEGMTLRDYFAAKALVGLFAQEANPRSGIDVEPFRADKPEHIEGVAKISYMLADAMLRARDA